MGRVLVEFLGLFVAGEVVVVGVFPLVGGGFLGLDLARAANRSWVVSRLFSRSELTNEYIGVFFSC